MAAKGHWLALVLGNTQAVGGVHVLQGSAGIHEDEIMHGGLDEIMAQEEAAEQDVLTQLRQRAASLERDLLQRSLDRAAPTSKASQRVMRRVTSEREYTPLAGVDHHRLQALDADNRRMQAELTNLRREMFRRQTLSFKGSRSRAQTDDTDSILPQPGTGTRQELEQKTREVQHLQQEVARLRQQRDAARMQSNHGASSSAKQALNRRSGGRGWLQSLEIENERLQGELDALRQRAVSTPQHELRAKNERLTAQLREVEKSDKTRAQLGFEVAHLKQELDKLRRSDGKNSTVALHRQLKEFTLNTQMDLEREVAATRSRALVAEEQLQSLQHYIAQSTLAYQKEIMRLRSLLSGSYQVAGMGKAGLAAPDGVRPPLHRSGSAGDALHTGSSERLELRPVRSATNRQGRLPRPMNQRPAVDAWHTH
ncbi:hypothetical protein ABBQ32_002081 [Trebouxia sp. C0010 RCD-2024]